MSNVLDKIFNEVCLDERVSDGIFRMEEEQHMNALRDYFVKRGIAKESAVHVTNRMVEGRFPERQAYNKDGILVTFPTPKHKANAIAKGTHFEKNPAPQNSAPKAEEPKKAPPGSDPEPGEVPSDSKPKDISPDKKDSGNIGGSLPKSSTDDEDGSDEERPRGNIFQQGQELEVEPPRGETKAEPLPATPPVEAPRTPQRIAAEKEVVKNIFDTDDSSLTNVSTPLNVNEKALNHQLNELYKKADEWGFREAVTFLTPHIRL